MPNSLILVWRGMDEAMSQQGLWGHMGIQLLSILLQVTLVYIIVFVHVQMQPVS
jgi:hypothetical protein